MRRGFAAALVTLALLLAGCAPGPEQPAPSPAEATDPPADLPAADDAVTALVAALNARDVSTLPMVRNPADEVTAGACSRRTTTSRTGRSPTLSTMPRTLTTGSLVVVTISGLTWSMRSCRNACAPGSPAA